MLRLITKHTNLIKMHHDIFVHKLQQAKKASKAKLFIVFRHMAISLLETFL